MSARGIPAESRFWENVIKTETCWLWTAHKTPAGYGRLRDARVKQCSAHRFSYELHRGAIPDGLCVCHTCDVRTCVNPEHLFIGTHADNLADRDRKGRGACRERHGRSKLSSADVRSIRLQLAQGASLRGLARQFGVVQSQIGKIKSGANWAGVH